MTMCKNQITGVILAGGQSSRMGSDKGLVKLGEKFMFEHIACQLAPQVSTLIISSNQNHAIYGKHYPVVTDTATGSLGPLAGMLAALQSSPTPWVACVPCDVPDLPDNLVKRLWQGKEQSLAVFASDEQRAHPTLCLLHQKLIPLLEQYLQQGERKLMVFFQKVSAQKVLFQHTPRFSNLNTPEDVTLWLKAHGLSHG
jgi:molybdopterin-guanine dinucleotide biosynthesis protein A